MAKKSARAKRNRAKTRVLSGRGGYFDKSKNGEVTAIGKALRALGGLGGGALAPFAGADPAAGNLAGRTLGASLSKWLGYGAYKVRSNSLVTGNTTIPMMHSVGQSVVVRHREYVGDIKSSIVYAKQMEMALNPGLPTSFPWLSSVARQYQEYTWRGMVFHFVPTVGEAVSATVPAFGNVMMHTEYRVTAPPPANKAELLNEYFASDGRPCEPIVHPIECDPRENPYNVQYVRTGPVPPGEDAKTYDLGMFRCYTQGQAAANTVMGELWITYEVELRKPQLTSQAGDVAWFRGTGTVAPASPFGTTISVFKNSLGVTAAGITNAGRLTFPPTLQGKFLVSLFWNPGGSASSGSVTLTFTGTTQLSIMGVSGTDGMALALPGAAVTGAAVSFALQTNGVDVQLVDVEVATLTNYNGMTITVMRLPMDL